MTAGEVLAGAVVQFMRQAQPLVFLRLHQPASQIRAFALGRDPLGNVLGDPIEPPRLTGFIDFDTALGAFSQRVAWSSGRIIRYSIS